MNKTLDKLRAYADLDRQERAATAERARCEKLLTAEAAAPLIRAFRDIQYEPLRVPVLRSIWGSSFEHRDERLVGLLMDLLGAEDAPRGIKLRIPSGSLCFEVDLGRSKEPEYICVRETQGLRPTVARFVDQGHWLEYFYKVLADMVEVR